MITNQNRFILDYLRSVKTHPSAEIIYSAVKKKLPRISRGTVYRNLKSLKERGQVMEIPSDVSRYDSDLSPHGHFFCQECGKIFDIFEKCGILEHTKVKVGKINHYQIYFYGTCKNCRSGKEFLPRLPERNEVGGRRN
ncbi:MAG: transcriptional repressor [Patescibacteria group bacterium]